MENRGIMKFSINKTLLTNLFTDPSPLDRKSQIFFTLHERMFPCKEMFIEFLTTVDDSERMVCAKYILQRLCFESNFPPPYILLRDFLDFEKDSLNKSSNDTYIPQDHFFHIVYTYLLGIYLFFYSTFVNKELTKEFIRKRDVKSINPALDAVKDFISYWKYFCLFHDIAYPFERIASIDNPEASDILKKYFSGVNALDRVLSREILVKGITKYLILWQLLNDNENNTSFEKTLTLNLSPNIEKFIKYSEHEMKNIHQIIADYGDYKSIDKIHCFEHFKMLTGLISKDEGYITVLFDALTDRPIAFKITALTYVDYYILQKRNSPVSEVQIIQYLDHEEYLLDYKFYVRYYFKDLDSKVNYMYIDDGGGNQFNYDQYQAILNELYNISSTRKYKSKEVVYFNQITTSSDLSAYIFQCYQTLLIYFNRICSPTKSVESHSTGLQTKNNERILQKYFHDYFESSYKKIIIKYIFSEELTKDILLQKYRLLNEDEIKKIVNRIIDGTFDKEKIKKNVRDIKHDLSSTLLNNLRDQSALHSTIIEFIVSCNKCIFKRKDFEFKDIFCLNDKCVNFENLEEILKKDSKVEKTLNDEWKYIAKNGGKDSSEIEKNNLITGFIKLYKSKNYLYDHGIYGAVLFLLCFRFYNKTIIGLFKNSDKKECDREKSDKEKCDKKYIFRNIIKTLCWNIESSKYQEKLTNNYEHIIPAVFKSVLYHNLYLDELSGFFNEGNDSDKWAYSFQKDAAIYFGMMVDALQVWNRNKYYLHSDTDWWPPFSSDSYDIYINGNQIVLRIEDNNNDIKKIIDKFIGEKESYLKGFSTYIKIDIIHNSNK